MSHIIYGQNKIICHIDLSQELKTNSNKFLSMNQLVLMVHHFQYPCVHYQKIYNYFKNVLPQKFTYLHIRLRYNDVELASDLPIGLFLDNQCYLKICLSQFQISDPFKIIKQSWKQAFTAINPNKGCYYIYRQLGASELRRKIEKYFNGQTHNLQNQQYEGYEGTNVVTRFLIQGQIIERKSQATQNKSIRQIIQQQIPQLNGRNINVKSHGVQFDLGMSSKQFLDQWSYNDGFCYLKIDVSQ